MRVRLASVAICVLVLQFADVAAAAPGDLDPTFSGDGKATYNLGTTTAPLNERVSDAAVQPDDSIVYVGERAEGNGASISRVDPDGDIDTAFGVNGHVAFPISTLNIANAVALQPDGKIIVVGGRLSPGAQGGEFVVVRLNSNGQLDTGFGTGGIAAIDTSATGEQLRDVAVQANGGIVATGIQQTPPNPQTAVALRISGADGSIDTGFGTGGIAPVTGINATGGQSSPVLALAGNDLLVAGTSTSPPGFAVLKLDGATGSPASGFGTAGIAVNDFGPGLNVQSANAIEVGAGGEIVVAGDLSVSGPSKDAGIARFEADGDPDATFDSDGSLVVSLGAFDSVEGLVLPSGGGVRIAGYTGPDSQATNADIVVAAYDAAGAPVGGFGTAGVTTTDLGTSEGARALVQQGSDLVIAGDKRAANQPFAFPSPFGSDVVLARYDGTDGSLDSSFGDNGTRIFADTVTRDSREFAGGSALQPDGKLLIGGSTDRPNGQFKTALTRVNVDGTLDTGFGTGGTVEFDPLSGGEQANAVAVQPDGKILVAGGGSLASPPGSPRWFVTRFTATGGVDTGFGTGGTATLDVGGFFQLVNDIAVQPDGSIVLVGAGNDSGNQSFSDMTVARLDGGGAPDTSFGGGDGIAYASPAPGMQQSSQASSVAIQADGKILAGGVSFTANAGDFAVARFNGDGSLDTGFGTAGVGTADFGGNEGANDIAIDPDGNIVAVGSTNQPPPGMGQPPGPSDSAAARFLAADGQLDLSFGTAGKLTRDVGDSDVLTSVSVQPDGKILASGTSGGSFSGPGGTNDWFLTRILPGGGPDTSFGTGGDAEPDLSGFVSDVHLMADGRIVLAGTTDSNGALAAARFLGDPPGAPTVTGTTPAIPADDNNPEVTGTAPAGTTVRIYTNSACSGVDIGDGSAAAFNGPGIEVFVPDDTTSTFYATASNANGTSACSAAGPTYVEVTPGPSDEASGDASPGGTISTNGEATPSDPVGTSVTTPSGGDVTITEEATTTTEPSGFSLLGQQVDIDAPLETAAIPLVLVFDIDASLLPAGVDETNLQVFRNGAAVADCDAGAGTSATPDPCVAGRTISGGDITLTVRTSQASIWNFGVATASPPGDGGSPSGDTGQGTPNNPPVTNPPPSSTPPKKCKKGAKLKKGKCVKKKKKRKKKK